MGTTVVNGLGMVLSAMGLLVSLSALGGAGWSKAVTNYLSTFPVNRLSDGVHSDSSGPIFGGEPVTIPSASLRVNNSSRGRDQESFEITALSNELVVNILANLSTRELLICKYVCKNWQRLITTVPALACAAYRSCHPAGCVPRLNDTIKVYQGSIRQWLNGFSERGSKAVTRLDGVLASGGPHFPEQLFFTIANLLDETPAFDCRKVCTVQHIDAIFGAGFSPDQQHLLSYSNHTIHICSFVDEGWRHVDTFWQAGRIICAYFSPDSKYLIALFHSSRARIWALADGQWQQQVDWSPALLQSCPLFNADTTRLVIVSNNDHAQIHRVIDGKWQLQQVTGLDYHPVWGARFHPKEPDLLVTYCQDSITLWRAVDGQWQEYGRLLHAYVVADIKFSPDGRRLMTYARDPDRPSSKAKVSIHVWHYVGGAWREEAVLWPIYPGDTAHFSPCGHYILTSSGQSHMEIWHLSGGRWQEIKTLLPQHGISGDFSPDKHHYLTTQNWINNVVMWKSMDELLRGEIAIPYYAPLPCVRFSPHGNHLVAAQSTETATIWGVFAGRWQQKATIRHAGGLRAVRFSPYGNYVLTTQDSTVTTWSLNGQE